MEFFDYGASAELFPGRQRTKMTGAVTYKRFAVAAEAIRYAVEVLPATLSWGHTSRRTRKGSTPRESANCTIGPNIRCPGGPPKFETACFGNDEPPRADRAT
jgi:hypothetical protein